MMDQPTEDPHQRRKSQDMLLRVIGVGTAILIVATGVASGCSPLDPPPTPKGIEEALSEAFQIENLRSRQDAIGAVLETYITNRSNEEVDLALSYLFRNSRWIDLRPYEYLIPLIPEGNLRKLGVTLFGMNRFLRDSREDRLVHYRRALVEGVTDVYGYRMTREASIINSSADGLGMLLPQIREYYPKTRRGFRDWNPLDGIEMGIALRDGAPDRDSAAIQAIMEVWGIDDSELRDRLSKDRFFQRYVGRTSDHVCARNPYTGDIDPACNLVLDIYIRQQCWWIEEQDRREANGESPMARSSCGTHPVRWIGMLERHIFEDWPFTHHFEEAWSNTESCGETK
jgi:hypothetical protein